MYHIIGNVLSRKKNFFWGGGGGGGGELNISNTGAKGSAP